MIKREQAIDFLLEHPDKFGHMLGFAKLTDLHRDWIRDMVLSEYDSTLLAHRGSYKTTCVSIALALIILLKPRTHTMFMRKTDSDVKEIIEQVQKILLDSHTQYFAQAIYGANIKLTSASATIANTNLSTDVRGTPQLLGIGLGSSLTGKHFEYIFTDDIVNINDRYSKAERERTKAVYQELQNIKMRDGRIFNTGTPWHPEDCFKIMPPAEVWDCYSTGLISDEEIAKLKESMTPSLYAANYLMKHIADGDRIFANPQINAEPYLAEQGMAHVDASYGGEDYTALTICNKKDGVYYVFGKLWQKHVDDVETQIIKYRQQFNAGAINCEDNGDKGYLAKQFRKLGEKAVTYHEKMNKHLKIETYLKAEWGKVQFVAGTDNEYIQQIVDYNEDAEHDDAPDSLACCVRKLWRRNSSDDKKIKSIWE